MNPKLVLFLPDLQSTLLTDPVFNRSIKNTFDVEIYNQVTTYDPKATLFVVAHNHYDNFKSTIRQLLDSGYKVLVENLFEMQPLTTIDHPNLFHIISNSNPLLSANSQIIQVPLFYWFYLNSIYTTQIKIRPLDRAMDQFDKKFLMLINKQKPIRDYIFDRIKPYLKDSLYSYRGQKIKIEEALTPKDELWSYTADVDWYNRTKFSIVVETEMTADPGSILLSEKTFKPIALQHPFMILGNKGSLNLLHTAGFITFDNIFDESYDLIEKDYERVDRVIWQTSRSIFTEYDAETQKRIAHNLRWFFNQPIVEARYKTTVVDPLLECISRGQ
jgi:hypothetical protein